MSIHSDAVKLLKGQQQEFIVRLSRNEDSELLRSRYEGSPSELKIISTSKEGNGDLEVARVFAWEMTNKFCRYKNNAQSAKEIFRNHLKGKLGEIAVKHCLGELITPTNYKILGGGDGKIDFEGQLDRSVGIQVKTRYGNKKSQWIFSTDEVEVNEFLVCILICSTDDTTEFDEFKSEYRVVVAGFTTRDLVKAQQDITGGFDSFEVRLDELLHGSGLKTQILESSVRRPEWREFGLDIESEHGEICGLAISPDNKFIILGTTFHETHFYDLETRRVKEPRVEFPEHDGDVRFLAIEYSGKHFVSADRAAPRIWSLGENQCNSCINLPMPDYRGIRIRSLFYIGVGTCLVASLSNNSLVKWDTISNEIIKQKEFDFSIKSCAFSPKNCGLFAFVGRAHNERNSKNVNIYIWDSSTDRLGKFSPGHAEIDKVFFADNNNLVSCGSGSIKTWNIFSSIFDGQKPILNQEILDVPLISQASLAFKSNLIAIFDVSGNVFIYDLVTGEKIKEFPGNISSRFGENVLAFSSDEKLLVAGAQHQIRVTSQ
jgi:WD40 repeat protein